ncbi:MAG: hypothetical protein DHS20C17_30660 [Cyclobacteriaceae bacterium]|nr:MAG: hypothetical protein DHS20C17_30660 [Cyclobacteriaceae bacterium]
MKIFSILFTVVFMWQLSAAQDMTLIIKHRSTGSVYEVDPEKAVKCKLSSGVIKRGHIQSLNPESMVVDGEVVNFDDIVMLSSWHTRKNASAKTGGIVLTSLGGLLTAAGVVIIAESAKDNNDVGLALGVPVGAAATAVGLGTTYMGIRALKRKRFDMVDWDFVVESY